MKNWKVLRFEYGFCWSLSIDFISKQQGIREIRRHTTNSSGVPDGQQFPVHFCNSSNRTITCTMSYIIGIQILHSKCPLLRQTFLCNLCLYCLGPCVFLIPKTSQIIWFCSLVTLNVADESYFRNVSCAQNLKSTFLFQYVIVLFVRMIWCISNIFYLPSQQSIYLRGFTDPAPVIAYERNNQAYHMFLPDYHFTNTIFIGLS